MKIYSLKTNLKFNQKNFEKNDKKMMILIVKRIRKRIIKK